jgi:alpha 1,3-glucosidase
MKSWYDLGLLYIFFRAHSAFNTIRREPWLFNDDIKNSIISNIKLRYNLLMFFYTKFFEYTLHGVSILKPLWMLFHNDEKIFEKLLNIKEQGSIFVIGKELIGINNYYITEDTIKILNEIDTKKKILYNLFDGEILNGKFKKDEKLMTQKIIIGGSIIPWTEKNELCAYYVMRAPINVKIFLDEKMSARGYYYLDDGLSYNNEGHFAYVEILVENNKINIRNINVGNDVGSGKIKDIIPIWNFIEIYGFNSKINQILFEEKEFLNFETLNNNGIKIELIKKNIKAFQPINIIIK